MSSSSHRMIRVLRRPGRMTFVEWTEDLERCASAGQIEIVSRPEHEGDVARVHSLAAPVAEGTEGGAGSARAKRTAMLSTRLADDELMAARHLAQGRGMDVSELIRQLLREETERQRARNV